MDRTAPIILVQVLPEGQRDAIPVDSSARITSLEYEDCEEKADALKLTVDNFDLSAFDNPYWKKGNFLIVSWGYPGAMTPPRKCCIQKVTGFKELAIQANAVSLLMHSTRRCRTWENMTRSEVVRAIAAEWGYGTDMQKVQDTTTRYEVISQARQTDASFLKRLAHLEGCQFYTDFDGLHWHPRNLGQPVHRTYTYYTDRGGGEILDGVSIENDITAKPARVEVKGRDPDEKKDISFYADENAAVGVNPANPNEVHIRYVGLAPVPEVVASRLTDEAVRLEAQAADLRERATGRGSGGRAIAAAVAGPFYTDEADRLERRARLARTVATANVRITQDGQTVLMDYPNFPSDLEPQSQEDSEALAAMEDIALSGIPAGYGAVPETRTAAQTVQPTPQTQPEAVQQEATATFARAQQTTVKMKVPIIGDPTLLAKTVIELRGLGQRLSGKYYVTDVKHVIKGGYVCEVSVRSDGTQGYRRPDFPEVARETTQQNGDPPGYVPDMEDPNGPRTVTEKEEIDPDTGEPYKVYYDAQGRQVGSEHYTPTELWERTHGEE